MSALLDWANTLQGPVGIVIGVAGSKFFSRKKDSAEATQIIANTAVFLIEPLRKEIAELTTRVGTLETENTQTKSKLQKAIDHIRELRSWISAQIPDKTPPQAPAELGL